MTDIVENQLVKIINESQLEPTKAQFILDNFKHYFELASEWEIKAKSIIVTNETQNAEMKMARTGRLFLREKRNDIEKARKKLKEQSIREGKAIEGIANVLKALIIPIEEYLDKQEHFVEIREAEKQEIIRLEVEKKIEEERLEAERLEKLENSRRQIALPYKLYWTCEYNLRIMSDRDFNSLIQELKQKHKNDIDEKERISKENEKLKLEAIEKERLKQCELKKLEELRIKEQQANDLFIKKELEKQKQLILERNKQEKIIEQEQKKRLEEKEIQERKFAEEQEKHRKEKERLEQELKNLIECPNCHHKFKREE